MMQAAEAPRGTAGELVLCSIRAVSWGSERSRPTRAVLKIVPERWISCRLVGDAISSRGALTTAIVRHPC
jgi:hypothetical protein